MQKLLLDDQITKLLANGKFNANDPENPKDFRPVVKLFVPWGSATWLLTELDEDRDTAFGLCDLGMGCPELGNVSLSELRSIRHQSGLYIERDIHFTAGKTLLEYATEARSCGRIIA